MIIIEFNNIATDGFKRTFFRRGFSGRDMNMAPAFEQIADDFRKIMLQQFRSRGARGGAKWANLSNITKEHKKKMGYPMNPLIGSGRMALSLTSKGASGSVEEIKPLAFKIGTKVVSRKGAPYPIFHQMGARQKGVTVRQQAWLSHNLGWRPKLGHVIVLPQRKIINLTTRDKKRWQKSFLQKHFIKLIRGDDPRFTSPWLKSRGK